MLSLEILWTVTSGGFQMLMRLEIALNEIHVIIAKTVEPSAKSQFSY